LHDDLARALDEVAGATGTAPRLYRPPYGVLSAVALLAARRGFTVEPLAEHAAGASWQYHRGHSA
jgi:peptidoglycan/xylan/chitin deacetylase (PgdA/CDA1 family)